MSDAAAFARLFVAIPVARPISETLSKMQPPSNESVRPVAEGDFHITLHFLGTHAIEPVDRALQTVKAEPFITRLNRIGHFSLRGRRKVLWAGVESVAGLIALHNESATALASVGFKLETRPYRPHVTLARVTARKAATVAHEFAGSPLPGGPIEVECREFALFASEGGPGGAHYRILESYPLLAEA